MKKTNMLAFGVLVAVALAACAIRQPPASPADISRAQLKWPAASAAQLTDGRQVVIRRCGTCHQTPDPREFTGDRWIEVVGSMAKRAHLTPEEHEAAVRYGWSLTRN